MKTDGAVWKKFYNDETYWLGYYHDDVLITFDGVEQEDYNAPEDSAVVKVESGYVYKEEEEGFHTSARDMTLSSFFCKWKKTQTTEVLVVTVDKDYADSVRGEIGQLEGVKGVK